MKIYPSNYDEFPNASLGEELIYKKLRESKKENDWIVIHSLEILEHVRKDQSEADFLILIPKIGVLVLEVKSCKSVSFDGNKWTLGTKVEKRGPFKQASDNMYSIMDYLKSSNIDISNVPFVYAVWFTHIPQKDIPPAISWKPEQLLTSEHMKTDVIDVLQRTTRNLVDLLNLHQKGKNVSSDVLEEISQVLLPRFVAHQAPKDRQKDVNAFLEKAVAQQLETVALLEELRAVALQGLAGTGKTFIAIHAAKQAHERGERSLFLCYNHMLAEFLRNQLQNFPLVKVASYHAFMLEVAEIAVPNGVDQSWWDKTLLDEAIKNLDKFSEVTKYDTIIIDEAQDIGSAELLLVLDEITDGGLTKSKRLLICGDFSHQSVYLPKIDTLTNYKDAIPDLQVFKTLLTNCRNPPVLGDFLNEFLSMDPSYKNFRRTDADGVVEPIVYKSEKEIIHSLKSALTKLLLKFTPDQIVILSAKKTKLWESLSKIDLRFTEIRNPKTGYIRYGSPQEFKGLEALAVLLVEFADFNGVLDETFYIAATRSVHDFYFVISKDKIRQLIMGAGLDRT